MLDNLTQYPAEFHYRILPIVFQVLGKVVGGETLIQRESTLPTPIAADTKVRIPKWGSHQSLQNVDMLMNLTGLWTVLL